MQHGSRYASGLAPSESFVHAWPARRERNPQGLVAPRGKLIGGYVEYITTSRRAMALIVIAVGVYGLGIAFGIAAYATVTAASLNTFIDFMHAHDWLLFAGSLIAWGAVCTAGWELLLRRSLEDLWEVSAAALGTLLFAIGLLVNAASSEEATSANVVSAVGIGIWGLLTLSRAARSSLREEQVKGDRTTIQHQAPLWLATAIGLFIFAIGWGLTVRLNNTSSGITAGVLQAVGIAMLFGALVTARARGFLISSAGPIVLGGLAVLVAGFISFAVVSGLEFGHDGTLTGLRVGVSTTDTIMLIALITLGSAAWVRFREIVLHDSRNALV